jgi:hypothetical protein
MTEQCVVCQTELKSMSAKPDATAYDCPSCGSYTLTASALAEVAADIAGVTNGRAKLSHALCLITKSQSGVKIDSQRLKDLIATTQLPKPAELLDNFILWLGGAQASLGASCEIADNIGSLIGATEPDDVAFLVDHGKRVGLTEGSVERFGNGAFQIMPLNLTIDGWLRFEELKRGASTARSAFMAMQFGNAELDGIYKTHLIAAVAATGFDLHRVDEEQPAGLIDDHLRVRIRQARFLIADLTHQNRGAYWEAGFAEGLGKPVIYMCRKDVFEDKTLGTHFDTNHHLTVIWDPADIPDFIRRLKATIRATLPAEAVLEDLRAPIAS